MSEGKSPPRSPAKLEILVKEPETTEDLVVLALARGGLEEVVKVLQNWCGSSEIREAVKKGLSSREPVDRFLHARRHAVEIYAKQHSLVPATLMADIVGRRGRKGPQGAERYQLRKAREFLENDEYALAAAKALAGHWENNRAGKLDHGAYLKKITQGFTFEKRRV